MSLAQNWKPSRFPQGSIFTRIQALQAESAPSIILHTDRDDLWVEEVVLKNDDHPGEYRLILDFWPLQTQGSDEKQNATEEPAVISALAQGERIPKPRS